MICKPTVILYCNGDISEIENYNLAMSDTNNVWECHHKLETHNFDGEKRFTDLKKQELIALDMYFNRPPEELIFLTKSEHRSLHHKGKESQMRGRHLSIETRQKISNSNKGKCKGREPWNKGKTGVYDKNTLKKLSEASKGRRHSPETRKKIGEKSRGRKDSEDVKAKKSKIASQRTLITKKAYMEYKANGGLLKWNDWQKEYYA